MSPARSFTSSASYRRLRGRARRPRCPVDGARPTGIEEPSDVLRLAGIKPTPRRVELLKRLLAADEPAKTFAEFYQLLGHEVPPSTVYRLLVDFANADVLERSGDSNGLARFRLSPLLFAHRSTLVPAIAPLDAHFVST